MFQIGLVVSCSVVLMAFEWATVETIPHYVSLDDDLKKVNYMVITKEEPVLENIQEQPKDDQQDRDQDQDQDQDQDNNLNNENISKDFEEADNNKDVKTGLETAGSGLDITKRKRRKIKVDINNILNNFEVTKEAQFPGDMYAFLGDVIEYPRNAKKIGKEAVVHVEFIVGKDGVVRDAKVLKNQGFGFDEEAVSAVHKMPTWIPAEQFGEKVAVRYVLPIRFELGQ